jgi:hypothetical protein
MKTILSLFLLVALSTNLNAQCSVTTAVSPSCYQCDGTATAFPTGAPPFTYVWSTIPVSTAPTVTSLCPDTFTVTITDSLGCVATDTFIVLPDILLSIFPTPASCGACPDGTASAVASGGNPPYTYLWNTGDITPTINNLVPGIYYCCVYDINGCETCDTVSVVYPVGVDELLSESELILYPNPARDKIVLSRSTCAINTVEIFTIFGERAIDAIHLTRAAGILAIDVNMLVPGVYFLRAAIRGGVINQMLVISK